MANKWSLSPEEKQSILASVKKKVTQKKRQRRIVLYLTGAAAAAITLLFMLVSGIKNSSSMPTDSDNLLSQANETITNNTDIRLVLADDKTIAFEHDADIQYDEKGEIIATSGDEQIKNTTNKTDEITYHTLIVPKGKRSSLTLADGTKAWVNSGSSLKFPSSFQTDKREIWVEGEVYLDVKKNKAQPFYVNTSRMMINVIGTSFNIMAYPEDTEQSVVLVEGSVEVVTSQEKTRLSPNQMLSMKGAGLSIREINVYDYISWKDGYLRFSDEPLANIMIRLSRYYDIPIECEENTGAIKCDGKLVLFDDIANVFKTIYHTAPIQYTIQEDKIIVSRRDK